MSAALIDKLLTGLIDKSAKRWDLEMRRHFHGYPHIIKIQKEDLINTYVYNAVYSMHHDQKGQNAILKLYNVKTPRQLRQEKGGGKITLQDKMEAQKRLLQNSETAVKEAGEVAATYVYNNFKTLFKKITGRTKGLLVTKSGPWIIRQSTLSDASLRHMLAQEGLKIMRRELKGKKLAKGGSLEEHFVERYDKRTDSTVKREVVGYTFQRRVQVLHEDDTTVGAGALATIIESEDILLSKADDPIEQMAITKALKTFREVYGPVVAEWKRIEAAKTKGKEWAAGEDTGIWLTIGPTALNPPGSESTDWAQLRPKLEKLIQKSLANDSKLAKFATAKGSKSFTQRVGEKAAGNIMRNLAKAARQGGAKARVTKSFKESRYVNKKGSFKSKGKQAKISASGGIKRRGGTGSQIKNVTTKATARTNRSDLNIIALLNAKLPKEVMNNMSSPSLENISGTFAQSVKALRTTAKGGMTNIIYTYDKDPYQVFEMGGRGDKRWATQARDPRNIIDKSIREIAGQMMMAKFVTTRI